MTPEEKEQWIVASKEAKAILALEGLYPSEIDNEIEKAVLDGRITHSDAINEMLEYVKKHQKLDGFLKSRTWINKTMSI